MPDFAVTSPPPEDHGARERSLIERARDNPDAFGELYRMHYRSVVGYLLRRTGDRHAAEDLACETFIAAFRAIGRYRDRGVPFRCWLLRIATNQANAWAKRRRRLTLSTDAALMNARATNTPSPDHALTLDEAQAALLALSPAHQAVLTLHHVEDLTLEQVGAVLGLCPGTVKSRLARARARLEEELLRRRGTP